MWDYLDRQTLLNLPEPYNPRERSINLTAIVTEASCIYTLPKAPWLNWIEQPPPKGQVAGSNPAGVANKYVFKNIF